MIAARLPHLILRAADGRDLSDVMTVMDEAFDPAFGEGWTRAQALGILGVSGVWLTMARIGATPAGFSLCRLVADEAELLLLAVRPAQRRGGVGASLLGQAMTNAARRGAAKMHLEVRENNPALALYRASGFAEVGRRPRYYRGRDGIVYDALTLSMAIAREEACN